MVKEDFVEEVPVPKPLHEFEFRPIGRWQESIMVKVLL